MAKCERECEEFEDISQVLYASPNAKIHSVVTSVSPMKKAKMCSYFNGEVSNGKASMRVFGFDSGVRKRLAEFRDSRSPVTLANCGWSDTASDTIKDIGCLQGQSLAIPPANTITHLFQRLAICFWRGNASMWVSRIPIRSAVVDGVI